MSKEDYPDEEWVVYDTDIEKVVMGDFESEEEAEEWATQRSYNVAGYDVRTKSDTQ